VEAKLYKGSTSLVAHADPTTLSRLKSHRPSILSPKETHPKESTSAEARMATQKDYHRLLRAHVGVHFLRKTSTICFDAMKDRMIIMESTERACAADRFWKKI
jgi:hypothetical protein